MIHPNAEKLHGNMYRRGYHPLAASQDLYNQLHDAFYHDEVLNMEDEPSVLELIDDFIFNWFGAGSED
jgi:hypothetical protein